MQEAVGELEAPFEYRFTVPAAYSAGGLGNAAGVTPLLPSDEHAPVLSAPFAGYYLIKSLVSACTSVCVRACGGG